MYMKVRRGHFLIRPEKRGNPPGGTGEHGVISLWVLEPHEITHVIRTEKLPVHNETGQYPETVVV